MLSFPVPHHILEFAQVHVRCVGDAIQPSHPLSSPSPAFNLSQHQGLSQWVGYWHQVAKVLKLHLQHQCFQWVQGLFKVDWFEVSKELSGVFSSIWGQILVFTFFFLNPSFSLRGCRCGWWLPLALSNIHPNSQLLRAYLRSSSVQFSHSVVSNSLQPHGLQHARLPCPSSTPGVHSNSCPSCQWYHPTISSSAIPFSSCLIFFPPSGSF